MSYVTISATTEIPLQGEQWFKGTPIDIVNYRSLLKTKYTSEEYGAIVPREYFLEPYDKVLKLIQRYFTCEGRSRRIYQYHFRLLMHFTWKGPLDLPLYFFRSLCKMEDKVQGKKCQVEPSGFHFYLNKLLVVEEIKRRNQSWEAFIDSSKLKTRFQASPWSKKDTTSSMERDVQSPIESSLKRP